MNTPKSARLSRPPQGCPMSPLKGGGTVGHLGPCVGHGTRDTSGTMSLKAAVNQFYKRDRARDAQRDTGRSAPERSGTKCGTPQNSADPQAAMGGVAIEGVPAEWLGGVAKLVRLPCPPDVLPARWRILQTDAPRFLKIWGAQAVRLRWTTHDLFGVNATKPLAQLDSAGLVRLLNGRPVVAMTASEAVIECKTGARQTYRRKSMPPASGRVQCVLWELVDGPR